MVREHRDEYPSESQAIRSIADKLGTHPDTVSWKINPVNPVKTDLPAPGLRFPWSIPLPRLYRSAAAWP